MKRYFTAIIFFLTAISFSYSQDIYQMHKAMDFFKINQLHSGKWESTLTENNIQGSPYLNDEFVNGTIFTTSKLQFVDVPLRYNIYNDQIEFKTPENEVQALATPEIVESVDFGNFKMVYVPFSNAKRIRHGFFKIELEGNASLYARSEITLKKATKAGAYEEAKPPKFINKLDTYYIRIGIEQAQKVGNKKELLEIFPDHHNKISTFIKKNKIKTNNPEKLKELVQFFNSL